jgi:acetyl esterase/lipase
MKSPIELSYGSLSTYQSIDLYVPEGTPPVNGFPVVLNIHGGAFKWGDKTKDVDQRDALLEAGFAFAGVGYRLTGEAIFPACIDDIRDAVRFLKENASQYSLDVNRFVAWGRSAGGYLATAAGLIPEKFEGFDEHAQHSGSPSVAAVVTWYGPSDFNLMDEQFRQSPPTNGEKTQIHDVPDSPESVLLGGPIQEMGETARRASALTWAAASRIPVPFFIAHGDQDVLVPRQQSEVLAQALEAKGYPVEFCVLRDAPHGGQRFEVELGSKAIQWLKNVLG